jgi:hypothetical protein
MFHCGLLSFLTPFKNLGDRSGLIWEAATRITTEVTEVTEGGKVV